MTGTTTRITRAAIGVLLLLLARTASSFDTGHHQDMTRNALQMEGFSEAAIRSVQVHNWLTDYYGAHQGTCDPNYSVLRNRLELLHFDGLFSTESVRRYWLQLLFGTRYAVRKAALRNDAPRILALIGYSLHAVQDFYSHSNWVDAYPPQASGPLRPRTWFEVENSSGVNAAIFTGWYDPAFEVDPCGAHLPSAPPKPGPGETVRLHNDAGGELGLNKDSYNRNGWDAAYISGYVASREWLQDIQYTVNSACPGLWLSIKDLSLDSTAMEVVNRDLDASYEISLWIAHWKGAGTLDGPALFVETVAWAKGRDSPLVDQMKERVAFAPLTGGLYETGTKVPAQKPPVLPFSGKEWFLEVDTTRLQVLDPFRPDEYRVQPLGKLSLDSGFGAAHEAREIPLGTTGQARQRRTLYFCPSSTAKVKIRYAAQDLKFKHPVIDLSSTPTKTYLDLTFEPSTGQCSGDVSTCTATSPADSTGNGDGYRARVTFSITARPLR